MLSPSSHRKKTNDSGKRSIPSSKDAASTSICRERFYGVNKIEKEVSGTSIWSGRELLEGLRSSGPILLGVIPFGITCGVMGSTAGLTPFETVAMSLIVFAGSAQFIAITMITSGAGCGLIVLTTLIVNLRHLLMGASLAPSMAPLSFPRKMLLSFLMTDEAYAVTISRIDSKGYSPAYQFGVGISIYVIWTFTTMAGALAGSRIPDPLAWGLDFALPATFLVLLLPRLKDRISLTVCVVAGVISVAGSVCLPGKWYMIAAALAAVVTGGILEGVKARAE